MYTEPGILQIYIELERNIRTPQVAIVDLHYCTVRISSVSVNTTYRELVIAKKMIVVVSILT